jgi:hypothetical protein
VPSNSRIPKVYFTRVLSRCTTTQAPAPDRTRGILLDKPCRLFRGATSDGGYGVIRCRPGTCGNPSGIVHVHRLVNWYLHGPIIPSRIQVDHLCRRRLCCEDTHHIRRPPREHMRISRNDQLEDQR